ncbi:protoheme IX farnesyltransferase [Sulfurifustis variabilis]|uniref:Protoheme IX farnesyltransferase n=1 Tax=Sulfurifustis variabilis TaxID=1675686 RepID=A0A1B4V058_9GAMM|nr:heme o synthase [Sulfurifustis variabilis]BAU46829.1 protoheme IX farnesyltransferase [Sulfurifustis variabilis]
MRTIALLIVPRPLQALAAVRRVLAILKLRIGITIVFTALAGYAITPGRPLSGVETLVLALATLLAASAAGAFNHWYERDIDTRMGRTRGRPFATGEFETHAGWLAFFALLLAAGVMLGALLHPRVGLFLFLGAVTYGGLYTVCLKRKTSLNIVIGGLAGSFAVLAGAAAADPLIGPRAWVLALVLLLWTPSHFWSLASALREQYAQAGVPMLPAVVGPRAAAWVVFGNTVLLAAASLWLARFGFTWIYLAGALAGGALLLARNVRMLRDHSARAAMKGFHASLVQLTLVLIAAMADVYLGGA